MKCSNCGKSIWCPTWGEWKCTAYKKRVYARKDIVECDEYIKRPANWPEVPCRCKDCLDNEKLSEEDVNE